MISKVSTNHENRAKQDSVATLIDRLLKSSPYAALRNLECSLVNGSLTLSGRVPTPHTKGIALRIAKSFATWSRFEDQVEVDWPK